MSEQRKIVILAGPNGAGKTTDAREHVDKALVDAWAVDDNSGAAPILIEREARR